MSLLQLKNHASKAKENGLLISSEASSLDEVARSHFAAWRGVGDDITWK